MDNNQNNNMNQTVDSQVNENFNQQPMPTQVQQPMYQQPMPTQVQPKKKFNWILWIAVALIIPIVIGIILRTIGANMLNSGPDMAPVGMFIKSLGTLAMLLLTFPSLLIVIIIGVTRGNKK